MDNIILSTIPRDELVQEITQEVLTGLRELINHNTNADEAIEYITRKETAKLLNISLVTLSSWTKRSILKSYKIGSRVLYKKSEVIESLREVEQFRGN